nr:hypothetical protein [Sphingobium fuliginis]
MKFTLKAAFAALSLGAVTLSAAPPPPIRRPGPDMARAMAATTGSMAAATTMAVTKAGAVPAA